jgi:hypothetical protein
MQYDSIYKGYGIKWRDADDLYALIWPPNSSLMLIDTPQATREEGRRCLETRTYAIIDAEIEKSV